MKVILLLWLLLLVSPAFGELTKEDLRVIIKEEIRPIIKEEIEASEKRTREYIDLKIDGVNARIDGLEKSLNNRIDGLEKSLDAKIGTVNARIDGLDDRLDDVDKKFDRIWLAILALIAAAVALPQLIIVYTERRRERELQTLVQQLYDKVETTQSPSS